MTTNNQPEWVGGIKYNDKVGANTALTTRIIGKYKREAIERINAHNIEVYNAQRNTSLDAANKVLEPIWCDESDG